MGKRRDFEPLEQQFRGICDQFRAALEAYWHVNARECRRIAAGLLAGVNEDCRAAVIGEAKRLEDLGQVHEWTEEHVREQLDKVTDSLGVLLRVAHAAPAGALFQELLACCRLITIYQDVDGDEEPFCRVSATVRADSRRRWGEQRLDATRKDAVEALLHVFEAVRQKVCRRCGVSKPLHQFSNSAARQAKDGKNRYCLQCERERVRAYATKKRRQKADNTGGGA